MATIVQWTATAVKRTSKVNFQIIKEETLFWCRRQTTFQMHHLQITWPKSRRTTGSLYRCRALTSRKARNRKAVRRSTGREATSMPSVKGIIVTSRCRWSLLRQAVAARTLTMSRKSAKCNNRCSNNSNSATGAPTRVHCWLPSKRLRTSPWTFQTRSATSKVRPKSMAIKKTKSTDIIN
jgi:hypothetical protein